MAEIAVRTRPNHVRPARFISLRARILLTLLPAVGVASAVGALAITLVVWGWPLSRIDSWAGAALAVFAILCLLMGAAALAAGYLAVTPAARRLKELLRVAEAVADGDFSQRTGFASSDEIGALGRRLDVMAGRLQERNGKLSSAARSHDEELTRLGAILASIGDGVVMLDRRARIVTINDAARRMLGSEDGFWSSDIARLVEHLDPGKALAPQLKAESRVQVNTRQGRVLEAEASVVTTLKGDELGTVIVIRDMTREALTIRLKDQFIAQVSHELRTPLTAIKGAADVLAQALPPDAPGYKLLATINRNALVLDGMIGDLLDISEMLAGTFSIRREPVALEPLLWEALGVYRPRFEAAGLELQTYILDADLHIQGDAQRLRWALCHLLDNAHKYSQRGGGVTVTLGELIFGHAVIDIADAGVGISPRDLPHIFEPYYRGEPVTPDGRRLDPRGLGLGLFVARTVAEAHGGSLTVVTEEGKGTTFSMVLPLAPE